MYKMLALHILFLIQDTTNIVITVTLNLLRDFGQRNPTTQTYSTTFCQYRADTECAL